jgi:hypothetical protein
MSRPLDNRGKSSQNSWVRHRMVPIIGLGALGKRHISCQLPGINLLKPTCYVMHQQV